LPFESVAWILNVPEDFGVPVTAPVEVFSVRPHGRLPTTVNVYGPVPPVTVIGPLLNGTPTIPVLFTPQVTETPGLIVIEQADPTLPFASVTLMVKVPEAVGVPVTAPVEAFSVRPAGSVPVPTENVYGAVPPVTVIAPLLKATPCIPVVVFEQVTESPATMVNGQVPAATAPLASVTLIVNVPAAVGVPVMAPVEAFNVSPAGNVPVAIENV
jgi:hypothetical protein